MVHAPLELEHERRIADKGQKRCPTACGWFPGRSPDEIVSPMLPSGKPPTVDDEPGPCVVHIEDRWPGLQRSPETPRPAATAGGGRQSHPPDSPNVDVELCHGGRTGTKLRRSDLFSLLSLHTTPCRWAQRHSGRSCLLLRGRGSLGAPSPSDDGSLPSRKSCARGAVFDPDALDVCEPRSTVRLSLSHASPGALSRMHGPRMKLTLHPPSSSGAGNVLGRRQF